MLNRSRKTPLRLRLLALVFLVMSLLPLAPTTMSAAQPEDDDFDMYESPTFGYTLTFDSSVWAVNGEDNSPDNDADLLMLENGVSFIILIGTSDFGSDELEHCVSSTAEAFTTDENIRSSEPLEDPGAAGVEDDRVWVTYDYTFVRSAGADGLH